jgi:ATP-dependent DNA helicase DinG
MGELSERTENAFAPKGPLATRLGAKFRRREGQVEMAMTVADVFENGGVAVVEAGTGVGKSFAYLIPAIYLTTSDPSARVVIATNKINLQHQLMEKDIPALRMALDAEGGACLVKGRANYISLRRLDNALLTYGRSFFRAQLTVIAQWAAGSQSGDKAELEKYLHDAAATGVFPEKYEDEVLRFWSDVESDRHDCLRDRCDHFTECFFYKARSAAKEARIVVTNHHTLILDAVLDELHENAEVLPSYDYLVVDEAHSLVESVTSCLSAEVSHHTFTRLIQRLLDRRHGLVAETAESLETQRRELELTQLISAELESLLRRVDDLTTAYFQSLERQSRGTVQQDRATSVQQIPYRNPLTSADTSRPTWKDNPDFPALEELHAIAERLRKIVALAKEQDLSAQPTSDDLVCRHCAVLVSLIEHIETLCLFANLSDDRWSRWFEWQVAEDRSRELLLVIAPIDAGTFIKNLLTKRKAAVLTSATLSTAKDFGHVLREWGISKNRRSSDVRVITRCVESPFDYRRNCLLAIPTDLPEPQENSFSAQASALIRQIVQIVDGRTFLLFTSWEDLERFWNLLRDDLERAGFTPLAQQRHGKRLVVTEQFKSNYRPVLFATASFWEGVDIPGEQLSCVVIVKQPFPVPNTPLLEDRVRYRNLDSFNDLMLPMMIGRLRQGFGRLIRSETDRGAVVILDSRLTRRSYSHLVLKSLPSAKLVCESQKKLLSRLREFF